MSDRVRPMKTLLGSLTWLLLVGACEHPSDRPVEWETIHAAIIVPSCATSSCHSSLSRTAGINLEEAEQSYEFLLEKGFVVAGNASSPLLFLLEGDERSLMPPDAPLPNADINLIRSWIELGALP